MKQPDIDALARLLDGDLPEGEAPAEARALGTFAKALESSAARPPAFDGKLELRAALIEAARESAAAPGLLARMRGSISETTTRWRYSMRLAAATGAGAVALSGGGVAVASQHALPGDALYGVKLALEDAGLLFIGDQVERGEQQLTNAAERMDEARRSAEASDMGGAMLALREADEASRAGARDIIQASQDRGDPGLLDLLATFSTQQRNRLTTLLPLLTGEAEVAANDLMVGLNRIDQRVAVLGGSCAVCDNEDPATAQTERQPSAGAQRDSVLVDARDFDFADIPPASEPFSPCPCVTSTGSSGAAGATDEPEEPVDEADDEPREVPRPPRDREPADDPQEEEPPPDEGPLPDADLPPPVDETVDDVEDDANDVIDDVLDELPVDDPPTLPPPGTSGGLPTPNIELP